MGSTKPYVHPHPVAKMFCFRRCTQQHQPSTSASCARTLCWHQKKSESESKFWMGKYPIGHLFLFWDCDSEILFLLWKTIEQKKGFKLCPMRKSFPQPPINTCILGGFEVFFAMKTRDEKKHRWVPLTSDMNHDLQKPAQWILGCHENVWILFPFIPQTWKEGIRGCGSINLMLFDVLNIHFTADLCDSSPENCGFFEESIEICLMEQTVRKPSVAVHLSEHLRTKHQRCKYPKPPSCKKIINSTPVIKDAIGGTTIENKNDGVFFSRPLIKNSMFGIRGL